jgi:hypothetical protein
MELGDLLLKAKEVTVELIGPHSFIGHTFIFFSMDV